MVITGRTGQTRQVPLSIAVLQSPSVHGIIPNHRQSACLRRGWEATVATGGALGHLGVRRYLLNLAKFHRGSKCSSSCVKSQ